MGNNLCGNDPYCSNVIRVGDFATIHMRKDDEDSHDDDGRYKFWTISYYVYESTCTLNLWKCIDENDRVDEVILELRDDTCFGSGIRIYIEREQKNYIWIRQRPGRPFIDFISYKRTLNTKEENVIATELSRYGGGTRGGLFVLVVYTKNSYPYKATVAHYYGFSRGLERRDIGLSIVVDIWASNNNLNCKVEGPSRHPACALFYMFDRVFRTGIWKVTSCPHCADELENQGGGNSKNNLISMPTGNTNWSLDLINNKDINGNGNGNRIERNQIIIY